MAQPPETPPKAPNSPTPDPGYPPVGPQPPDAPLENNLWALGQQQAAYGCFEMGTSYTQDDGILQIPLAGPPGSAAVLIQLHGGFMRKFVGVEGSRVGLPPSLPALAPQDPLNEVRAGFAVNPQIPLLQSEGEQYVYRVASSLTFYLEESLTPFDGYRMGSSPTTTTSPDAQVLDAGNFEDDIL